jgi:hypothetical protein
MTTENTEGLDLRCPSCGSGNVTESIETYRAKYPYGKQIEMPIAFHACLACAMEGDFVGGNDAIVEAAHRLARLSATRPIFEALETCGVTRSYFERVIGLPQGAATRWCDEGCSPAELALAWLIIQNTNTLHTMDRMGWWRG